MLGWAGLPGVTAAAALASGPARAADAPPNAQVRQARQRLDKLERLLADAAAAQWQAGPLQRALQSVAPPWRAAIDSAVPAQQAVLHWRADALPAAADRHARWRQAADAVDTAVADHLAAIDRVLQAPDGTRAAAMAQLDARTVARQAAELAERSAWADRVPAGATLRTALARVQTRWADLVDPVRTTADILRQNARSWQAQQQRWQAVQQQARAAGVAGDTGGPAATTTATTATGAALPPGAAPWAVPPPWVPPTSPSHAASVAWDIWQQADGDTWQALRAVWLQRDARAAVQQALADALCNAQAGGCTAWRADDDTLQAGLARQQAALAAARASQAAAADQSRALAQAAPQQLQAVVDWRDSLAPAVALSGGMALRTLQAAMARGETAMAAWRLARDAAEAAWRAAWRRQYGDEPPALARAAAEMPRAAMSASMPEGVEAVASTRPELGSHALHRLRSRGDEPPGFGAYTYVLVGASVRPDTPGVHARLQRLLAQVRNLPVAAGIALADRDRINTFVVPVPADSREGGELVVDLPLAQSLLTHLPPALRLATATRRQLYAENGPFLITVPGRLADARADWPLLFADLSRTPEAVVGDVVRRYMADLIGSFNPASTDWSPPAGMQVAITLVRLVKGSGDVVQAVFGGAGR